MRETLLKPKDDEREGYMPYIVYRCGFLRHGCKLILPFVVSDYASSSATVALDEA